MRLSRNHRWLFVAFLLFGITVSASEFLITRLYFSGFAEQVALSNAVKKTLERQNFLARFLDRARLQLVALRSAPAVQDAVTGGDTKDLREVLRTALSMTPSIRRIDLVDAAGNRRLGVGRTLADDTAHALAGDGGGPACPIGNPRDYPRERVSFSQPRLIDDPTRDAGQVEVLMSVLPIAVGDRLTGALTICHEIGETLDELFRAPLYRMILADADGEILRHHDARLNWSRFTGGEDLHALTPLAPNLLSQPLYRDVHQVSRRLTLPLDKPLFMILSLNDAYLRQQEAHFAEQAWINLGLTIVLTALLAAAVIPVISRLDLSLSTSRRHAAELQAKNRQIEQLITLATDGVHILDNRGDIVRCSRSFADMLGYTMEEAGALNVRDWEAALDQEALVEALQTQLGQSTTRTVETLHRRKDGSVFDVELQMHGIDFDGQRYLYASARDISSKKRYAEHLEREVSARTADLNAAKQLAESANRAKSRFLANMSHELRTPMHAILSYAGLALRKSDSDKVRQYQQKILDSGERLTDTLDKLLQLSDLESDSLAGRPGRNDLRAIVDAQLHACANACAAKSIDVRVEGAATLVGLFDATLISRVVEQLLGNAITFSPEHGSILVELREIDSMNGDSEQRCLSFSIHDQGVGIPAEDLERVFGKFTQSSLHDDLTGGTGLGLAICQQIIERHQGRIRAASPVENAGLRTGDGNAGTTVQFQIPREPLGDDVRRQARAA